MAARSLTAESLLNLNYPLSIHLSDSQSNSKKKACSLTMSAGCDRQWNTGRVRERSTSETGHNKVI